MLEDNLDELDALLNARANRRDAAAEQDKRDLAAVLATPAGFRVIAGLLKHDCGLGNYLSRNAEQIALHNLGERLLRRACEADPGNGLRLLGAIRNIEM